MDHLAIQARFPQLVQLFYYNHIGYITGINHTFTWLNYNHNILVEYILFLSSTSESKNIQKYTDIDGLVYRILKIK